MVNSSLIVQFRTDGWGSEDDLTKRYHLEDLLDARLQADNNGICDGGDIGSGTINIFLNRLLT